MDGHILEPGANRYRGRVCSFGQCPKYRSECYGPDYWLDLEVPTDTPFGHLDRVLRGIWLECCGHMSAFRFRRRPLPRLTPGDFSAMWAAAMSDFQEQFLAEQQLMAEPVGKHLEPGMVLDYEYDFGSSTDLPLRVVGQRPSSLSRPVVRLLARNDSPDIPCVKCVNLPPESAWAAVGKATRRCAPPAPAVTSAATKGSCPSSILPAPGSVATGAHPSNRSLGGLRAGGWTRAGAVGTMPA